MTRASFLLALLILTLTAFSAPQGQRGQGGGRGGRGRPASTMDSSFRESLFTQLGQRVRDVRTGPDGFIYFTTDDPIGRVMRIEPQ